jgi:hypothetical protein
MTLDAALFSARPESIYPNPHPSTDLSPTLSPRSALCFPAALSSLFPALSHEGCILYHEIEAHPLTPQRHPHSLAKTPGWHQERFLLPLVNSRFAVNFFGRNTYSRSPRFAVFWPKLAASKSIRINTCRNSRCNSFRSNTYKNKGREALVAGNALSAPSRWFGGTSLPMGGERLIHRSHQPSPQRLWGNWFAGLKPSDDSAGQLVAVLGANADRIGGRRIHCGSDQTASSGNARV